MQIKKTQANFEFTLDINSFKEIPFDKYPKDFSFIVNGKEFKINRIFADILSPIVCQYHFTDATINQFVITTEDSNPQIDFSKIISLLSFQPKLLTKEDAEYLIEIFSILGNKKEAYKLIPKIDEKITIQNVFSQIQHKQKYCLFFKQKQCQKDAIGDENNFAEILRAELDFVSSHFFEIDKNEIKKLDSELIEEILKSDKLVIEDEDSLLKFVNSIYSKNSKYAYLYSYVNFILVSNDELCHFSEIFDINDINNHIWKSIIDRALKSKVEGECLKSNQSSRKYRLKGFPLLHKENDEFNGIIKYLTNKTGGNIHDNGTINVTSSEYYREPKNLLDFNENSYYQTQRLKDGWVIFDFKNRKVKITDYQIKSNNSAKNGSNMKSWNIEVSNDGKSWTKIDERKNCEEINGCRLVGTFKVKENDFSRYIRLIQTENNWSNNYAWFYYIEFYGYMQK